MKPGVETGCRAASRCPVVGGAFATRFWGSAITETITETITEMVTESIELYLVRHARAFDRDGAAWPDDSRRPLTHRGRDRFARLARRLGRGMPPVELLESSGFTRAWQTALLLHGEAGWPPPVRFEALESADPASIVGMRRSLAAMRGIRSVAWVGHEPQLGRLASLLLTGRPDGMSMVFRKGGVMRLEVPTNPDAAARLVWMVTPRLMRGR